MFNLRSRNAGLMGAGMAKQPGIQMPDVDPALMQQAAQAPQRRGGLFGRARDHMFGRREDGSNFLDRVSMAGMALQGDGRGAAAYGQNLRERQNETREQEQAQIQRRQRIEQATRLAQEVAPGNRALMNAAMMDPDAVLERYLGNMEATNVSAGSTRINPMTGQEYTAAEMFRQDGLFGTQRPDGVTFTDQDSLVREGMTADVANTRAGTANTYDQVRSRRAGDLRDDAAATRAPLERRFEGEDDIRGEWSAVATDANELYRAYDSIANAYNQNDAAGDLALIINFNKALDPGSVVRESEVTMAQGAASVAGNLANWQRRIQEGNTRLPPEVREQIVDWARGQQRIDERSLQTQRQGFESLVQERGLNPERVFINQPQRYLEVERGEGATQDNPVAMPSQAGAEYNRAYASLPSGAFYTHPDGTVRRKR